MKRVYTQFHDGRVRGGWHVEASDKDREVFGEGLRSYESWDPMPDLPRSQPMKYLDPKFSSRPASKEYREGWERTFGGPGSDRHPETIAHEERVLRAMVEGNWDAYAIRWKAKPRRAKKR